jgi:hypothetical protein
MIERGLIVLQAYNTFSDKKDYLIQRIGSRRTLNGKYTKLQIKR